MIITLARSTTEPNGLVPIPIDLFRCSEVEGGTLNVDEVAGWYGISIYFDYFGAVDMQVVVENIFAALECIQVPTMKLPYQICRMLSE